MVQPLITDEETEAGVWGPRPRGVSSGTAGRKSGSWTPPNLCGIQAARDEPKNHLPRERHQITQVLREKWPKTLPIPFGRFQVNYLPSEANGIML